MPTILIVDDDVALLARLGTQLEEAGYAVLRASDVRHAELLIAEQQPDIALLDTGMNRGAGWQLLERVAARLPVIVISGQGLEEDVIRGLDMGAIDYLTKPFRTGELLARLRIRLRAEPDDPEPAAAAPSEEQEASLAEPPDAASSPPAQPERPSAPAVKRRQRSDEEEEPVFMPYGEERRLLDESSPASGEDLAPEQIAQLSLGRRLHAARQHKRITLVQAELESKLRMHYIQAMEEEKFSLLPRGPIAEELLRTYASYLGLDVGQAIDEYRRQHYSEPVEPPPALGGRITPRALPRWAIWLSAIILALVVGFSGIWLIDPAGMTALAGRARILVAPPTATAPPTTTPLPTATTTPTPRPTATDTPVPTERPTLTPLPAETPTPLAAPLALRSRQP